MEIKVASIDTKRLWISQVEAMKYLGVSRDWFQDRRKSGELHYSKCGKMIFYIKTEIDNIIRKNAVTGLGLFKATR